MIYSNSLPKYPTAHIKLVARSSPRRAQRGVVLLIALIVLVAMSLAGIAMIRQVSSGVGIAGNLGFRQNAVSAADYGAEAARAWVTSQAPNSNVLLNDNPTNGFRSSVPAQVIDYTQSSAWTANASTSPITVNNSSDQTGNTVQYQVHRLCSVANISAYDPTNQCVMANSKAGFSNNQLGNPDLQTKGQPYFRITVRVQGTRGTTSTIQVMTY